MVIRDVTLSEKLVFGGLLPRVRVPLWFNRLDRNVVLLGPLSFIGTDSGVISYRDGCNNEGTPRDARQDMRLGQKSNAVRLDLDPGPAVGPGCPGLPCSHMPPVVRLLQIKPSPDG